MAKRGDLVIVNYHSSLDNGTVFDSSMLRGVPVDMKVGEGNVMPAFLGVLLTMRQGSKTTFRIPHTEPQVDGMPKGQALNFELELLKIKEPTGSSEKDRNSILNADLEGI